MKLAVRTSPGSGDTPRLDYSWDPETGMLAARIAGYNPRLTDECDFTDGIVSVTTPESAFMHFEIASGRMSAFEIALWPSLGESRALRLPEIEDGYSEVSFVACDKPVKEGALVGFTLPVDAQHDSTMGTLQLRFGSTRPQRTVRVADALLMGIDRLGNLTSLWFLRMPGFGESVEQAEKRAITEFEKEALSMRE